MWSFYFISDGLMIVAPVNFVDSCICLRVWTIEVPSDASLLLSLLGVVCQAVSMDSVNRISQIDEVPGTVRAT